MLDVFFYEVFDEEEKTLRKYLPKKISARFTCKTIQETEERDPPAKLISIRTQSQIPVDWAGKLDGIFARSQGFDHLIAYQKEAGSQVTCGHLDNYCSRAVGEHAVFVMMALFRKIKKQIKNFDKFNRDGITGFECKGRNALVVGVGNIGEEIVDCLLGLKMSVQGVDIEPKDQRIEYVSLKEGFKKADVIFCALPLTKETDNMFNYDILKGAKKGVVFINVSRGEISPIKIIKTLLDEEILGGVGLDVYCCEKELAAYLRGKEKKGTMDIEIICELKGRDNVIFTPHNAFNSVEALEKKAQLSAQQVTNFLKKKQFF